MKLGTELAGTGAASSSHDRILQAAKRLFSQNGFEGTSTMEIVRLAGTSESQLVKHFGGKEGLLEAVFNQGWVQISVKLGELDKLRSPQEKLVLMVEVMLTELNRDQSLKQLLLFEGRRIRKDRRLMLAAEGFLSFVRKVDAVLEEMQAAGQLKPGLNMQAVRSGLMGILEGLLRDQILGAESGYPASYSEVQMREAFNHLFSGVLAANI
jgi:TetR/AcrR family fatty acid metabolism transcriptional regulator